MTNKPLSLAVAVVATAMLGMMAAVPRSAQAQTAPVSADPASKVAKPSPYQGVSQPPANDVISTTDEQPVQPPASKAAPPAVNSTAPAAVAAAPPSPEVAADDDDDSTEDSAPRLSRSDRSRMEQSSKEISSADEDEGVVTYVPGPANALPEGTVFSVRMLQNVMASDVIPGTEFHAKLSQNLMHDGRVVVPIGSELRGKIVYATHGRRINGRSVIHLRPDEFILPDGTRYHLHAEVIDTQGSDTRATGEGNIASRGHGKRALVELAVGSGGGALIGAKLGGPAGAAVGSAIGAGVMGAHLLLANQSVDLPQASTVIFSLTGPMFLNPSRD